MRFKARPDDYRPCHNLGCDLRLAAERSRCFVNDSEAFRESYEAFDSTMLAERHLQEFVGTCRPLPELPPVQL
jgi:hypothetical protein